MPGMGEGYIVDFQSSTNLPETFQGNANAVGSIHRVGGSFPNIDLNYMESNNHAKQGVPADMSTVWGLKTQAGIIGEGLA